MAKDYCIYLERGRDNHQDFASTQQAALDLVNERGGQLVQVVAVLAANYQLLEGVYIYWRKP